MEENPLFTIAADHHRKDLTDGFDLKDKDSEITYTLGFCRGVAYATALHSKAIENLQNIVIQLQNQSK